MVAGGNEDGFGNDFKKGGTYIVKNSDKAKLPKDKDGNTIKLGNNDFTER